MPTPDIEDFLMELDKLKLVERKTYIDGGKRKENSAEHSWHLAISVWSLAEYFSLDLNHEVLIKLALIHDLGEIDAGDTFLYAKGRDGAAIEERKGVERIAHLPGNGIKDLTGHWDQQELGTSQEAKFLKVVDRILPFLHNVRSEGRAWQEMEVSKTQVENAQAFINNDFPEIYAWIQHYIELATDRGWLKPD